MTFTVFRVRHFLFLPDMTKSYNYASHDSYMALKVGGVIKLASSSNLAMVSQIIIITGNLEVVEIISFVRGYHDYKDIWDPAIGQMLLLKRQPDNNEDSQVMQ